MRRRVLYGRWARLAFPGAREKKRKRKSGQPTNTPRVLLANSCCLPCPRARTVRRPSTETTPGKHGEWPGAGSDAWLSRMMLLVAAASQHKTTLGVSKPLRIYLQVAIRMSYHYLEVNSKRLGGRCRMGLGAVNAAPCVHGRRSARGAVNKRPQAAARANHRRQAHAASTSESF